jgi:hypothetical protein
LTKSKTPTGERGKGREETIETREKQKKKTN